MSGEIVSDPYDPYNGFTPLTGLTQGQSSTTQDQEFIRNGGISPESHTADVDHQITDVGHLTVNQFTGSNITVINCDSFPY